MRRKIHKYEPIKRSYWINNDLNKERKINNGLIISDYLFSDEFKCQRMGMPFHRCILHFISKKYGSFDKLDDSFFDELWEILKFRFDFNTNQLIN